MSSPSTATAAARMPTGRLGALHLLSIADLSPEDVETVLTAAEEVKAAPREFAQSLAGKSLVLIFEKPSLRTRMTFALGMRQLGGSAEFLDHEKVKLGERESIKDVARNLERWCDGVVARTYKNKSVTELAQHSKIPIINGLTDLLHPCQGLTDLLTLREHFGNLRGLPLAYVGDGNNTCHSLIYGGTKLGMDVRVITPEGYEPNSRVVNAATRFAQESGAKLLIDNDLAAIEGCKAVYTDTWTSMGQEAETEERSQVFSEYRVDRELMDRAAPDSVFLHCLPAHRGHEVTAEVIDSERSLVYEQAENRLHTQKALLLLLMGNR